MIDVVGVGADGVAGLGAGPRALVENAEVLLGAPRLLAGLPQRAGREHRRWPSPMLAGLPALLAELGDRRVVALASGDPFVSGVGTTLIRLLGADDVRVHPAVSSVALARARMGWPAESCTVISLVSAPVETLARDLAPGARIIALSAGARTPGEVAELVAEHGYGRARMSVLARLGACGESRLDGTAGEWAGVADPLNVVCLELGEPDEPTSGAVFGYGTTPGLPDDAFVSDGQLTKWELRIAALARLRPVPGQLLWDLGAGSGSVGIEWARTHPRCRTIAVERDAARAARIETNARRLGVPATVEVRHGDVTGQLRGGGLPDPDAVFLGGGADADVVEMSVARLRAGGRLVAHAVTLQTEQVLLGAAGRHGGELRRLSVDRAEPLGRFLSWTPARPVLQWAWAKVPARAGQDVRAGLPLGEGDGP